jgi:hypothetical protein
MPSEKRGRDDGPTIRRFIYSNIFIYVAGGIFLLEMKKENPGTTKTEILTFVFTESKIVLIDSLCCCYNTLLETLFVFFLTRFFFRRFI